MSFVQINEKLSLTISFKNDQTSILKMAFKNQKMLQRIREAGLTKDQLNNIFPKTEATLGCDAWDGVLCVAELTGYFVCMF